MKTYKIDDSLVHRDEQGNFLYREVVSIIHYESTDDEPETVEWTADKALLELTIGSGIISGIPGVELVKDRYHDDGRVERIESLSMDIHALYELYLHLKKIDEENPDKIMW